MEACECQLGRRIATAALVAVLALTALAVRGGAAQAEIRTATMTDPPDPAVTYDLHKLWATYDREASTLMLVLYLHSPLPEELPGPDQRITISLGSNASPLEGNPLGCRIDPPASVGDATVTIAAAAQTSPIGAAWQHEPFDPRPQPGDLPGAALGATATLAPDATPHPLAVTISPQRRRLTLRVTDPLLAQAAPRCVHVSSAGRGAMTPPPPDGDESAYVDAMSGWFDGYGPTPPAPPDTGAPAPDGPAAGGPPAGPPSSAAPEAPMPAAASQAPPQSANACRAIATPGLVWDPFPRELALDSTALVPVAARSGRRIGRLMATITTMRDGTPVGTPTRISLPTRGYALQLRAPDRTGRLVVGLTWVERRGPGAGVECTQRSDGHIVELVKPIEPRLSIDGGGGRLTLAWGMPRHGCHALADTPLDVHVEGLGYVRDYRVEDRCGTWSPPGAALPDFAARRVGDTLQLTPRGVDDGSWSYRLTAHAGARDVASGLVVVTVGERDGETTRTIRFVPDRPVRAARRGHRVRDRTTAPQRRRMRDRPPARGSTRV